MSLLWSLLAAGAYTVGGVFMRKADGFAHLLPVAMVFLCFCTGAAMQTLAMRRSELSANYVLVLGLEAALALLLGVAWLGESMSSLKLGGVGLILAGVVSLRMAESETARVGPSPFTRQVVPVALRAATPADVGALLSLINGYAERGLLLPRSDASLRAGLADFVLAVARDADGEQIVGCGALARLSSKVGEVRSLAVRDTAVGGGVGRQIVSRLIAEGRRRGHVEILALSRRTSFFSSFGFIVTDRARFPEKLRTDCRTCRHHLDCDEVALVLPTGCRTERQGAIRSRLSGWRDRRPWSAPRAPG